MLTNKPKTKILVDNTERQHQSLDYRTPQEVYQGQERKVSEPYAPRDLSSKLQWHVPKNGPDGPKGRRKRN